MKKTLIALAIVTAIFVSFSTAYAGNGSHGAAPNSGDGVPDGSGMDGAYGPHGK